MWVWRHEMLTSPPEVLENGVRLMVQSPHLQQLLYFCLSRLEKEWACFT